MRLVHNRNFMRLQVGWSVSYLGTQLQAFAFSLYILRMTGSAMQFALTLGMEIAPSLLLAPVSGYLADRWDRRRQIVCCDLLSAGVTAVFLGWFWREGRLPVAGVYLCVLLLAGLHEFTSTASSGLMQAAVPPEDVTAQQTVGAVLRSLTAVAAPALGGILFGSAGLAAALGGNAASFLICAWLESRVSLPGSGSAPEAGGKFVRRFLAAQREAMVYIRRSPFLQSFLLLVTALNFIVPSTDVGLMALSQQIFAIPSAGMGAANAAVALGMTAGALCASAGRRPPRHPGLGGAIRRSTALTSGAFAACAVLLTALGYGRPFFARLPFWPAPSGTVPFVAVYGLFVVFHAAVAAGCGYLSVRIAAAFQQNVDPRIIGRTSALTGAVTVSAAPLGQLAAGALLSLLPAAAMYACECGLSGLTLFFARRIDHGRAESAIIEAETETPPAPAGAEGKRDAAE